MRWPDGRVYNGRFSGDSITDQEENAKSRFEWPDKAYYEGQFLNGLPHGRCRYKDAKRDFVAMYENGKKI